MAYPYSFGGYQPPQNFYQPQAPGYAPQIQQPPQQPMQAAPGYACRPVTSREEALGVQVDFFGAGTLMPDLAHGVIYLKRFNQQTGSCDLIEFSARVEKPEEPVRYATIDDLNALRAEFLRGGAANAE